MANKLVEAYKDRISVSNKVYASKHNGAAMNESKQVLVATLLNNVNKRMNEAFAGSAGTQVSNLGNWKRFCLALTTVAIPNLIAEDLVIVHPMTSIHGYIAYVKYSYGTAKGEVIQGQDMRDVFRMRNAAVDYTGDRVVEAAVNGATSFVASWTPTVKGVFKSGNTSYDVKVIKAGGTEEFYNYGDDGKTVDLTGHALATGDKVAYVYDNITIPQNDIPTLTASMEGIELHAKARRIGVMYSQMAAYEAKQDYGFDLPEQLSAQAVAELSYEIDSEIIELLYSTAKGNIDASFPEIKFDKKLPTGVGIKDHYVGFLEKVDECRQQVFNKTLKCTPNYMVCGTGVKTVLSCIDAFKAAGAGKMAGPYYAGTLEDLKVFVSPRLAKDDFFLGVNSADMATSAAVFAPYMAIVPTSLLDFADGSTTQGFSTMYDLKILNKDLLVKGSVYTSGNGEATAVVRG